MQPAPSFILVEPLEEKTTFQIAKTEDQKTVKSKVIQIGADSQRQGFTLTSPCKVGDVILHSSYGYQDFKQDGKEYRVVRFDDVLMIL